MSSLWFVVPVHGRIALAQICLRQMRRTCDALTEHGIEATAVVIADRDNLDELGDTHGFGTVERDNQYLSRRFNDGIQLALDPRYNARPADYVVPCGSDDWVDWRLFTDLPSQDTMVGFKNMSFVSEDGLELTRAYVNYPGGCGIRIWPREILRQLRYRPADEDRARGCDTSILVNTQRRAALFYIEQRESDPRQIVDWKSSGQQVNPYDEVVVRWRKATSYEPWAELADVYPADALEQMQAHYGRVLVAA